MSLTINNPKVCELAKEAARLLDTTETHAIEIALQHLVTSMDARAANHNLKPILERIDGVLTDDDRAALSAGLPYDELGLPC